MVGDEDDRIRPSQLSRRELDALRHGIDLVRRNVVVVQRDRRSQRDEAMDDRDRRSLPCIIGVPLVRQAEHQDVGTVHGLPPGVETELDAADTYAGMWALMSLAVSTNRKVTPSCRFDAPREVQRIDRQAVTADAGSRPEGHEPEGLRPRPRR